MLSPLKRNLILLNYSFAHFVIDLVCVTTVLSAIFHLSTGGKISLYVILTYNFLAFATQPFFGLLADKYYAPKLTALLGCLLVFPCIFLAANSLFLTAVLAGIGNSLFHIGGGGISLNLNPGRASAPGVFVAPGGIGLAAGLYFGKTGYFNPAIFAILLIIAIFGTIFLGRPVNQALPAKTERVDKYGWLLMALSLLLSVIFLRSLIGGAVSMPWKSDIDLLIALTLAISLGKALGGMLADRFGWQKTVLTGLIISAPLLTFFSQVPILGIIGIFLFQFTMPVTLTAINDLMPNRSAFAFGLPCLFLFIGSLPSFIGWNSFLSLPLPLLIMLLFSIAAIFIYFKNKNLKNFL